MEDMEFSEEDEAVVEIPEEDSPLEESGEDDELFEGEPLGVEEDLPVEDVGNAEGVTFTRAPNGSLVRH